MAKQRRIIVADCETDPFENGARIEPFIWGAFDGETYNEFQETNEFAEWAKDQHALIYAHNGGKFDWHFLVPHFEAHTRIMTIAGRVAKVPFGMAELRDSYSILPVPLSEMQKDEFDYSKMHKDVRHLHMPEIREYLRNDCEYLHEYVTEYINEYGRNLTVASAALAQWRKITKKQTPRTNASFYEKFAPYYYGGRVECFRKGVIKAPFKVIDINSAYPRAMMDKHPWGAEYVELDALPEKGVERCFITMTAKSLGAFPIREKTGLSFPSDGEIRRFEVTGWEYLAALETGALQDCAIETVLYFVDKIDFSEYVDYFYGKKKAAIKDTPPYLFAKLFLNSLYGKWGANPAKYKEQYIIPPEYIAAAEVNDGLTYAGSLGEMALMEKPLNESARRYFNVATAASITGWVRAEMWRSLHACSGLIYCDTDSIAAEKIGELEMDKEKLGAWDVEAVCDEAYVVAKKIYAFSQVEGTYKPKKGKKGGKWKTASKGVRLEPEEIMRAARGEEVRHEKDAPTFSLKKPLDGMSDKDVEKLYIGRTVRMN